MLSYFLINSIALYITARVVRGVHLQNFSAVIFSVLTLSLLNLFIKPLLVLLTLPFTILTFGLFILILNGLIFSMAAAIVKGFEVADLVAGIAGWIIYSLTSLALNYLWFSI